MDDKKFNVVIIGAGIAGSLVSYFIHKFNTNYSVLVIDKNAIGSHNPSYIISNRLANKLEIDNFAKNQINQYQYILDSNQINRISRELKSDPMLCVDYTQICQKFLKDSSILIDEVINIKQTGTELIVYTKQKKIITDYVIDASGWNSVLRERIGLVKPQIGTHTILKKLSNGNIDKNIMPMYVGDIASFGAWFEPVDNDKILIGTGYWDNLSNKFDSDLLKKMLSTYISFYPDLTNIEENEAHFAKISLDPVSKVVYGNIAWIGESCGQTDPYWSFGFTRIANLAKILGYSLKVHNLSIYQFHWKKQLLFSYAPLWAASRVLWNYDSTGWSKIFSYLRNSRKKSYTMTNMDDHSINLKQVISTYHPLILTQIMFYLLIFYLRILFPGFRRSYQFNYRRKTKVMKNRKD